eukprot:1394758-Amphidinium_carterae.1
MKDYKRQAFNYKAEMVAATATTTTATTTTRTMTTTKTTTHTKAIEIIVAIEAQNTQHIYNKTEIQRQTRARQQQSNTHIIDQSHECCARWQPWTCLISLPPLF